jgi:hypothetical protein
MEVAKSVELTVPPAASVPPGTMVLSTTGTDRTKLRVGVSLLVAGVFALGFLSGAAYGRGSGRDRP